MSQQDSELIIEDILKQLESALASEEIARCSSLVIDLNNTLRKVDFGGWESSKIQACNDYLNVLIDKVNLEKELTKTALLKYQTGRKVALKYTKL